MLGDASSPRGGRLEPGTLLSEDAAVEPFDTRGTLRCCLISVAILIQTAALALIWSKQLLHFAHVFQLILSVKIVPPCSHYIQISNASQEVDVFN